MDVCDRCLDRDADVRLSWVRLDDAQVAPLLRGLAGEYQSRYGDVDVMADATAQQFAPPTGAFVVATTASGSTVAGGGLRHLDDSTCEIKRMWTSPDHRREGLATRVLTALESRRRDLGYRRVRLETGPEQPEAVGLYERLGYQRIEVYGRYDEATAFERRLDR
jgi:ribosomal protein S18 acetylase RimI-like enzyme